MTGEEGVSAFFRRDHDGIDAILASADFGDAPRALKTLAEFDARLERHIVWEEELLFPAAARLAPPLEHGPIAVMREEHRAIRAAKREAFAALRAGDGATAKAAVGRMLAVLGPHNRKEEDILYPACDRLLAGAEAAKILAAVSLAKA